MFYYPVYYVPWIESNYVPKYAERTAINWMSTYLLTLCCANWPTAVLGLISFCLDKLRAVWLYKKEA